MIYSSLAVVVTEFHFMASFMLSFYYYTSRNNRDIPSYQGERECILYTILVHT